MEFILLSVPNELFIDAKNNHTIAYSIIGGFKRIMPNETGIVVLVPYIKKQSAKIHYEFTICEYDVLLMCVKYRYHIIHNDKIYTIRKSFVLNGGTVQREHLRCGRLNTVYSYDDICKRALGTADHPNHLILTARANCARNARATKSNN